MAAYVMALDAGTTSNRCIIFDAQAHVMALAQKEFTQHYPKSGWVEHDANEIWATQLSVAVEAMQKLGITAADIAAIGITNQRETTIVWDRRTGEPVFNAIVWQCRRTSEYCDSLKAKGLGEVIRQKTGLVLDAYFSATKLKWILDNVPGARERAERGELCFGTVDTSAESFKDAVYSALLEDSGMQLLFYMNGMWSVSGWTIKEDYAPAVRGATDVFAEYLAQTVNYEKIKSETNDRLVAMGGEALSDALTALGDTDAAQAALAAAKAAEDNVQSTVSSGSDAISTARQTLHTKFDVKIFQLILYTAAAVAVFMLVFSLVMFVMHRKEN